MTSQLILANGHGIALASDSAVTMGNRRTFETSEKIYPLPMPHRLAVMHAGNVMFHGLPFGTIINEWISSLGNVRLRSVHSYQENFHSWLLDNYRLWSSNEQLSRDVLSAFYFDFKRIWNEIKERIEVSEVEAINAYWKSEIEAAARFEDEPAHARARACAASDMKRFWEPAGGFGDLSIQKSFDYWFDDVATNEETRELAYQYALASLETRYPGSESDRAILTFVGYGISDLLPCTFALHVFGATWDLLYTVLGDGEFSQREGDAVFLIRPSGQYDAIDLIFRGFEVGFMEATKSAVNKALELSPKNVESDNAEIVRPGNEINTLIEDSFYRYSESKKLRGLRRSIAGMPLASLARTAKSLIEVQRLSLDIAGELQTVGGQVDVGVITLKDGFNWVRQKEYGDYLD